MRSTLLVAGAAALAVLLGVPASAATTAAAAVPAQPGGFTGYAFDTCEAPSQTDMNLWRTRSPFAAVGVYLAGENRLCDVQANLTPTWVSTQIANGWRILPITVGRQASCFEGAVTKIDPNPAGDYAAAQAQGEAEADATVAASQARGFAVGTTHWIDIEDFDISGDDCRRSMLRFVSGWTERLHALGYKSGLYSNVAAGITAIEGARTLSPGSYTLPDQIWFAHFNNAVTTDTTYVASTAWVRQRVHQYAGDVSATYGGVTLQIDRNWVDVGGGTRAPAPSASCGVQISFTSYVQLRRGDANKQVKAVQCLLKQRGVYTGQITGRYDLATQQAVLRYQRRLSTLADTGVVSPPTWTALLSAGTRPFLKVGAGSDAVRRVQRSLNAAVAAQLTVTGVFDRRTETAVRTYQGRRALPKTGIVDSVTWTQLQQGRR